MMLRVVAVAAAMLVPVPAKHIAREGWVLRIAVAKKVVGC